MVQPHRVVMPAGIAPRRAVLCFFRQVIDRLREDGAPVLFELQAAHGLHPVFGYEVDGEQIAVFHPGVGAPLAGGFFEEAIAHGCRRFMAVGTAGGLVPLALGHVIVPTFAIRDEGTSYHYQPAGRTTEPTPDATEALLATLRRHDVPFEIGGAWATDGPFPGTPGKGRPRLAGGCPPGGVGGGAPLSVARGPGGGVAPGPP